MSAAAAAACLLAVEGIRLCRSTRRSGNNALLFTTAIKPLVIKRCSAFNGL